MKVFNTNQIRACDTFTIQNEPIKSVDLMERAASGLCKWIVKKYKKTDSFVIFAGQGNNGGDALALARLLFSKKFVNIRVFVVGVLGSLSADCKVNFERLSEFKNIKLQFLNNNSILPNISIADIVIDGIFGSGLSRPIEGYFAKIIEHINNSKATVLAIDIPSGLFADNENDDKNNIVKADYTLSFQFPKMAFFFAENEKFVGIWHLINIGLSSNFISNEPTPYYYLQKKDIKKILKKRSLFSHKGTFGHALLVAGSYQQTGAAVLSARACLRSGVGLLTVHVPQSSYNILQTAVPEAMLLIDETETNYCATNVLQKFSAIGIGSGIGKKASVCGALKKLMQNAQIPMVIDADAINLLVENKELQKIIPKQSVLTPHPKEFDRLTQNHTNAYSRLQTQKELSAKWNVYIVLKGAFTSVSTPCGDVYFNSTGNSGMATAGSGDVLTGIVLSFLAQGYTAKQSVLMAVFIHGLAGDIAAKKHSKQALIASDIISYLGKAFNKIG